MDYSNSQLLTQSLNSRRQVFDSRWAKSGTTTLYLRHTYEGVGGGGGYRAGGSEYTKAGGDLYKGVLFFK